MDALLNNSIGSPPDLLAEAVVVYPGAVHCAELAHTFLLWLEYAVFTQRALVIEGKTLFLVCDQSLP